MPAIAALPGSAAERCQQRQCHAALWLELKSSGRDPGYQFSEMNIVIIIIIIIYIYIFIHLFIFIFRWTDIHWPRSVLHDYACLGWWSPSGQGVSVWPRVHQPAIVQCMLFRSWTTLLLLHPGGTWWNPSPLGMIAVMVRQPFHFRVTSQLYFEWSTCTHYYLGFFVTFCYGHAYWLYYRYSDDDGGGDDDDDDDDRHCNVRPFFHQSTPWMETNEGSRLGAVVLGQRNAQEHFGRVGSLCKSKCVCGFSISWNLEIYMIFLYFSAISAPTCSKCSTSSGDVWSICRETPVSLPVRALVLQGFHINRRRI